MDELDKRPSHLAALPLAIVFLFETWVWRHLVALARFIASLLPWVAFRDASRRVVNRMPAAFAVLLFGIPLAVAEVGAFVSVVMMATGHVTAGMALYVLMKIFGVLLLPVIFEITREKLMALRWFAYLYEKFEILHGMAARFVAPYREAAKAWARGVVASGRAAMRAFFYAPFLSAAKAKAANSDTASSSARTVAAKPTPSSH